jgi:hypothetical protein
VVFSCDIGIYERCHCTRLGNSFYQQPLPLAVKFRRKKADPGDVAARPCKPSGQPCANQILAHADKRYRFGSCVQRANIKFRTNDDDVWVGRDHSSDAFGYLLVADIESAENHGEILALDKTVKAQFVKEPVHGRRLARGGDHEADTIGAARLLRA